MKKLYHHTGVWEQRRGELFKAATDKQGNPYLDIDSEEENFEQETTHNWSCCGNTEK